MYGVWSLPNGTATSQASRARTRILVIIDEAHRGVPEEGAHTPSFAQAGSQDRSFLWKIEDNVEKFTTHLLCPITLELPVDPVVAEDGNVYERNAIEAQLKVRLKSPLTNEPMGTK